MHLLVQTTNVNPKPLFIRNGLKPQASYNLYSKPTHSKGAIVRRCYEETVGIISSKLELKVLNQKLKETESKGTGAGFS